MLKVSAPMDRSRKITLFKKKRLWKRLPDEEVMAFWKIFVEVAGKVRECAGMRKKRPHKMEIWTQDLYSLKIALNQLSYTKNLGCVFALRKLFFPTKQKHKTQHEYAKKNEPYGSKLALAGN